MGKHLVLAGGGHAHLTALKNLQTFAGDGHRVTVVTPSAYQYYSGMGPGMLGGTYRPQDIRLNIRRMTEDRGGTFVKDRVVRIEAGAKTLHLASGDTLTYDVVSFSIGSEVPARGLDTEAEHITTVKPIVNLHRLREQILDGSGPVDVAVIGGGPAGVELAGNLIDLLDEADHMGSVTIVAGRALLRGFPQRVRHLTRRVLTLKGVRFHQKTHVLSIEEGALSLSDGGRMKTDLVVLATGVRPPVLFKESDLTTGPDGGMLVNHYLQSVAHPELFGGGDCISLEGEQLAKVGVYAVRENPILFHNLRAALNGTPMKRFDPGGAYLLVFNLGGGKGVLHKGPVTFNGGLAFRIKDYLDRRFMREFQVSGEREEPM